MSADNWYEHIVQKITDIRHEIIALALQEVTILPVGKGRLAKEIQSSYIAGCINCGENYWQDFVIKRDFFEHHKIKQPIWHYIGALNSKRKIKKIAQAFDWVQTVPSIEVARDLNDMRLIADTPLNVCIQVNIGGETQKQGCTISDLNAIVDTIHDSPRLILRGLMALINPHLPTDEQFSQMKYLWDALKKHSPYIDCLSMGTSQDYREAVQYGATYIRLGRILFSTTNPEEVG